MNGSHSAAAGRVGWVGILNTSMTFRWVVKVDRLTALRKCAVWAVRAMAVLLALGFALAAPGVTDRRQILVVLGPMCATLLGLMMAVTAFIFRTHAEVLASEWGQTVGVTRGMKDFWRTMLSVVIALAASVLASTFGLLDPTGTFSVYLMVIAGFGLIYAVLTVPLLVGDMWGVLVISQGPGSGRGGK